MAVHGVIFDCLSKKIITVTVVMHQFFTLEMHNYKAIIEGSGSSVSKVIVIDITIDSQVNSKTPYRWSPASLTFNNYFYWVNSS